VYPPGRADAATISASKVWIVANGYDVSVITLSVVNTSSGNPVPGAQVTFTIDDDALGQMSPVSVTTGATGGATSTFITKTKSGTALITATITSNDDGSTPYTFSKTVNQQIDHDTPQAAFFDTPDSMIVGTVSNLNVTVKDAHGNLVDNKNGAETHSVPLHMPGADGQGLWNGTGYATDKTLTTDVNGNASTQFRIGNVAGYDNNYLYMDPIGNMVGSEYAYISGIADPDPVLIRQTYPSPSALPTDGTSKFTFTYTILDKYGNKILETPVEIITSDGGYALKKTNTFGYAYTTFGPKDFVGFYTISGGALNNTTAVCEDTHEIGNCTQVVEYYNTDPVDLMVMANPSGMASLDVDPAAFGTVLARVVDAKGNPVYNQTVTFSLGTPTYPGGPYHPISNPFITPTSATVGVGGYATTIFKPGAFAAYNLSDPLYNSTATGEVVVTASWTNLSGTVITRDVTFVWKNYPYLGIAVPPNACKEVKVGDQINITVSLSGDGAALKPKPINAILVMDRSGSMGGGMSGPAGAKTKIWYSNSSGYTFVDQMDPATDQIGLVTYSAAASYPVSLSTNFNAVKTGLKGMTASGNTNQRLATYLALQNLIALGADPSKTVQAIIVMTDGQYNTDGDPLARNLGIYPQASEGNWGDGSSYWYIIPGLGASTDPRQNLSYWARSNNVRIYTVTFGTDAAVQPGTALYNLMTSIAESTDGKHYHATDGSQAMDVYTKIAGDLKEVAGGNTTVSLNFQTIKVNDIVGGGDVRYYMHYVADSTPAPTGPLPTDSTYLNKTHWFSGNGTMSFYPTYPRVQDDTVAWDNKIMNFTPGDIKLADTWSTTFRLRLNASGKIELFGPASNSEICFTDASTDKKTCQFIPPLQCNIQESIVNKGLGNETLALENPSATSIANDPKMVKVAWLLTYTSTANQATQRISYTVRGKDQWQLVPGENIKFAGKSDKAPQFVTVDTSSWPYDDYTFRIEAFAQDAENAASVTADWTKSGGTAPNYIQLD
jgi:hypothetical protein